MRKRYEEEIKELKESFEEIIKLQQEQIKDLKTNFDSYKVAMAQREYLIKTKFKGTIKNKKLLEELKKAKFDYWYSDVGCRLRYNNIHILDAHCQIATSGEYSYDDLCKNIFEGRDTVCMDLLFILIKDLEQKQETLDKYGDNKNDDIKKKGAKE